MTVTYSEAGLTRAWRRTGYQDLFLELRPAPKDQAPSEMLARLAGALETANAALAGQHPEGDEFVYGEGPWPIQQGAVLLVSRCSSPNALGNWLSELARALDAAGVKAKLQAPRSTDLPSFVADIPPTVLTAFVSYHVVDEKADHPLPWNVGAADTSRILDLVETAASPGGTQTFSFAHGFVTEVGTAFRAATSRLLAQSGSALTVSTQQARRVLESHALNVNGTHLYSRYEPQVAWEDALAHARAVLTALPDLAVMGLVQHAPATSVDWDVLDGAQPQQPHGLREYHWRDRPDLRRTRVLDARGMMVLTSQHLDAAHNLDAWLVTPLEGDTHLVCSRDLAAWFAGPAPDADLLQAARSDFGSMILSPSDL